MKLELFKIGEFRAHFQDASTVASVPDPIDKKDSWYSACCHQTRKAEHQ